MPIQRTPKDAYDRRAPCDADGKPVAAVRRPLSGNGDCIAQYGAGSKKPMAWHEVSPDLAISPPGPELPHLPDVRYRVECTREELLPGCSPQLSDRVVDAVGFSHLECRKGETISDDNETRLCVEKICLAARGSRFAYPLSVCIKNRAVTTE